MKEITVEEFLKMTNVAPELSLISYDDSVRLEKLFTIPRESYPSSRIGDNSIIRSKLKPDLIKEVKGGKIILN